MESPDDLFEDSADESSEEDDVNWIQEQFNPMLEIFSILYLDTDVVSPQNQLGRIYMHTHVGNFDIYNVDEVDETRKTIMHKNEFDIMDIKGPIPFNEGSGGCLKFDFFRGAYRGSVYGVFRDLQFFSRHDAELKNISLDRLDGTGKVVVFMGLYAHATVARVEIRLNASVAANVYGTVSACNTRINDLSASSFLFLKEEERKIIVGTDGLIPLSKSRVAVPVEFELCLDFSLVVDGKHLETTVNFHARKAGVSTKTFESLSVTVHWDALYYQSNNEMNEGSDTMVLD